MPSKTRKNFAYDYPRPALTVDVVLLTRDDRPKVLLIRRGKEPFAGCWALPGGFVNDGERLIEAARRELKEETGIEAGDLEQLYTAGDPGRDPRGWTVSVVYFGLISEVAAIGGDDASAAAWHRLDKPPKLAFDHAAILQRAEARWTERRE